MNPLRNQRGISIIEVTVAAALMAALSVGIAKVMGSMGKAGTQMNATRTATMLKSGLISLVNSPTSWQRTIKEQEGGPLECFKKGGDCQGKGGAIGVYASDGSLEYDSDPNAGFTMGGAACNGFSPAGNFACPFQVKVEWEPICPAAAPAKCPNPQVRIVATFLYRAEAKGRGLAFNEGNYSFTMVRGQPLSNAEEFCLSLGATWDNETQHCNTKPVSCADVGGTYDSTSDTCNLVNEVACEPDEAVQQLVSQDGGGMKAICVPMSDEFDPFDYQPIPPSNPGMKDIAQEDVRGCKTGTSPVGEPDGVACRLDRPAGSTGTCYVRDTGKKEGWYRAGWGWCDGGVYVLDSYTGVGTAPATAGP